MGIMLGAAQLASLLGLLGAIFQSAVAARAAVTIVTPADTCSPSFNPHRQIFQFFYFPKSVCTYVVA